jgi:SAM-dependent methyltransferase
MAAEFDGELYERYRHGYPSEVLAAVGEAFRLTHRDMAIDLGCGTGQVTLPLAGLVGAVIGIDPEPSLLVTARRAAQRALAGNVTWQLGDDGDLRALNRVLGDRSIAVITIGQALHWMDRHALFDQARGMLRPGGGVAILTNGTPVWLQDSEWSRSVRSFLESWFDFEAIDPCGTDDPAQQRYRDELAGFGYVVQSERWTWTADLDFDQLLGSILSALGGDRLPVRAQRAAFTVGLREAVGPAERFTEPVPVSLIIGRID